MQLKIDLSLQLLLEFWSRRIGRWANDGKPWRINELPPTTRNAAIPRFYRIGPGSERNIRRAFPKIRRKLAVWASGLMWLFSSP